MIYYDDLILLEKDRITFKHYYYPFGQSKTVGLEDIEFIKVKEATIRNGKWRIHGTGNFKTWFPKDRHRPRRDKIFFAKLKGRRIDIGFTVEDSAQVEKIFREMSLIMDE